MPIFLAFAVTYACGALMFILLLTETHQFNEKDWKHWLAAIFGWIPLIAVAVLYTFWQPLRKK